MMATRLPPSGFSATTRPSESDADQIIGHVCSEIVSRTSTFDPTVVTNPSAPVAEHVTLGDLAKFAAILGAASYMESAHYPESQALGQDTPATTLNSRFMTAVQRLVDAIQRNRNQDRTTQLYLGNRRGVVEDVDA